METCSRCGQRLPEKVKWYKTNVFLDGNPLAIHGTRTAARWALDRLRAYVLHQGGLIDCRVPALSELKEEDLA
jgi:hypothetical protein